MAEVLTIHQQLILINNGTTPKPPWKTNNGNIYNEAFKIKINKMKERIKRIINWIK